MIPRGVPRAIALLAAGSIAVHELRYVVADSPNVGQAVAEPGHSSVSLVEALALVLLAIALVRFARVFRNARRGTAPASSPLPFVNLWLAAGGSLAAVFTLQETLEGALAPRDPETFVSVFQHGGWAALIFSALIGAAIALLAQIANVAIQIVAQRAAQARPARLATMVPRRRIRTQPEWRLRVLACHLAGRAPPTSIQP